MVDNLRAPTILLFAIGPVQSFIATARRTQDLFVGSYLLSDLAACGVRAAHDLGAIPVFPVPVNGALPSSVPNRFTVLVEEEQIQNTVASVEAALARRWTEISTSTRRFFATLTPSQDWTIAWKRQTEDWLEVYWAAWRWNESNEGYGKAFARAGFALNARKMARHFPKRPEPGEKCTLSGTHEALSAPNSTRDQIRTFWEHVRTQKVITPADLRRGERLSAISTIKRLALKQDAKVPGFERIRFASTSSIAAASFRADLLQRWDDELSASVARFTGALDALGKTRFAAQEPFPYLRNLQQGHAASEAGDLFLRYDGDFLYRDTYTANRLEEILGAAPASQKIHDAADALKDLLVLARSRGISAPHRYFAILYLDGDHMGDLVAACKDKARHAQLSAALASFAQHTVPAIVTQDHPGMLVYAGGDDVLALLPVTHALQVADRLTKAFGRELEKAGFPARTASAGIAISHHMQPLQAGLRAARQAEKAAKQEYGRNAVAVYVLRRSGEHQQVGLRWIAPSPTDDKEPASSVHPALRPFEQARTFMAMGQLSGKIAFDLAAEAVGIDGTRLAQAAAGQDQDETAFYLELLRLLKRHAPALAKDDADLLQDLARRLTGVANTQGQTTGQLATWLHLARFLAQGDQE